MSIKEDVKNYIKVNKPYNPNMTIDDVVEGLVTNRVNPPRMSETNPSLKEQGCPIVGGCACTGKCRELVPMTQIDKMVLEFHDDLVDSVAMFAESEGL